MNMPTEVDVPDAPNTAIASSSEVARRFGFYLDEALLRPVTIERHGVPRLVILSLDEYRRLAALDRRSFHPSELSDDDFDTLKSARDQLGGTSRFVT